MCNRKGISRFKDVKYRHGCALLHALPELFLTMDKIIASIGSSTTKVMIYKMSAG